MDILNKAIQFSAKAHEGQYRKTTNIPYISHPYTVGLLLLQTGCEEKVVVAGILHDVVEDTPYTIENIEEHFGRDVAEIVMGCSEPDKSLSWEKRKQHTIEYLKSASFEVKMVACADKTHNLISTYDAIQNMGDEAWNRFKRGKDSQEWYYRNIYTSIQCGLNGRTPEAKNLLHQLEYYINKVFK